MKFDFGIFTILNSGNIDWLSTIFYFVFTGRINIAFSKVLFKDILEGKFSYKKCVIANDERVCDIYSVKHNRTDAHVFILYPFKALR